MVQIDFDQFDDELQIMRELMDEGKIALSDESLNVPLKSLGLKKAVVVEVGSSMQQCVDVMLARHFGCLLVVDRESLRGIFTERDVLMKIAAQDVDLKKEKIDDFMTPDPASFKMEDSIEMALRHMDKGGYRHAAIVDDSNKPLAVISVRDLVSFICEFFPQDVLNLPPHPIRVGTKNQYGG